MAIFAVSGGILTGPVKVSGAEDARTMLQRCLENQEATDKVSFKVETDIVVKRAGSEIKQRAEAWIRRDGERADSIGRFEYLNMKTRSNEFRSVIDEARFIQSIKLLHGENGEKPRLGASISLNRARYLHGIFGVPHYGGFLDGFTGGTGGKRLVRLMLDEGTPRILDPETIGRVRCEVVSMKTRRGTVTVWVSPDEGYSVRKFRFEKVRGDIGDGDKPLEPPSSSDEGSTKIAQTTVADDIEISKVGGVFVAVSGNLAYQVRYSDGTVANESYSSRRKEIVIRPDFQGTDAFHIDLPNGTPVSDWDKQESGLQYEWRDGSILPAHSEFEVNAQGVFNPSNRQVWLIAGNIVLLLIVGFWGMRRAARQRTIRSS